MKKVIVLLLIMVTLLVGVGLVACGPKKDGTTPTPISPTTPSVTTTPSVSGLAWTDIPNYPSLRQVQRASQIMPPTAGYAKAEVRVYETNDSLEKIVAFYKEQMPAKGWEETQWLDTPQFSNGAYSKNGENDLALVWVFSQEGKTEVMLMRGNKE